MYSDCRKNSWESRKRTDNPLGTWVRLALHKERCPNGQQLRKLTTLVEEMQIRTESNTTTHPLECQNAQDTVSKGAETVLTKT